MGTRSRRSLFRADARSEWVRLRTLVILRWLAITGQLITVLLTSLVFDVQLPLDLCLLGIGISAVANLIAMAAYPETKRLTDHQTMLTLLFDLAQLTFLLYLTGGLNNPFALLIIVPVTISASALRLQSTLILGAVAIVFVTILAFDYIPLTTETGLTLRMPAVFVGGYWAAIVIGMSFLGAYIRRISVEVNGMSQALLATQMALSREQKLTDLGGVVAAAAHELGTPLATIKLVTGELTDELADREEALQDIALIREQTDRCRDILRSMGRAGKDDLHLRHAPLAAVVEEAAGPHARRGTEIHLNTVAMPGSEGTAQPVIERQPEIIHGIRNLVQNAVDFARAHVWIDVSWSAESISVRVIDDGPGYPPDLLGRIGDPFLRRRRRRPADDGQRPEYEGMGLGLFIAKTLLERTGGSVRFMNGSDPFLAAEELQTRSGAIAEVVWPLHAIALSREAQSAPLGENTPIPS